ncbi:MAG TPA: TIGR02530 family flagellar biosynthesis protein [Solirubrobacteraceae bacterium]|jgi:flagellar operon protein
MSAAAPTNPALIPGIGAVKPPAPGYAPGRSSTASSPRSGPAFAEVLEQASGSQPLHFSRHALERVQRRGIDLDPTTLSRLNEGVGRAAGKGSRDSVVLVDGTAFVVSVANRTVLTAVDQQHMREHVFTNIDSAVLA